MVKPSQFISILLNFYGLVRQSEEQKNVILRVELVRFFASSNNLSLKVTPYGIWTTSSSSHHHRSYVYRYDLESSKGV